MFEYILRKIQQKILSLEYVITLHAQEEMENDHFNMYDVEQGILGGRIIERQKEQKTGEWKYIIRGNTFSAFPIEIVAKIAITGKVVIITVYEP